MLKLIKKKLQERKIRSMIRVYMDNNEYINDPLLSHHTFTFDHIWKLKNGYEISHFRKPGGDLIELSDPHGKELIGWVDQSFHYAFLGINDFICNITECELRKILGELKERNKNEKT
jgi:hypothetical protein